MNWLDFLVMVLVLGIGIGQAFRGFGKAVFDALFLYAALFGASMLSLPLAHDVRFHAGAAINHSWAYGLLLVAFGGLALGLSRWVYGMTLIHTGMFEGLLGLVAGVAAGMMVAHGLVNAVAMADPAGNAGAQMVATGFFSSEMLDFHTYHSVIDALTGASNYRAQLPNVGGK